MYQFVLVFKGHGQCHQPGGQSFVITTNQVWDALVSLDFICESISNSLKLLSWKGKCAKVLNNCRVCISRTAMATSVSTSLSGWWRGEPTTTAFAFKWINQLLQSFQTKPLPQMGPGSTFVLLSMKDQGVQRFRHRGGSSRGFSSFRPRGQRIHNNNRSGWGLWFVMTHLCLFFAILNYH